MIAGTAELFFAEPIDVGVQRQQPVLAVDRAQNALAFGHLERADARVVARPAETTASRRTR